MSSFDDLSNSPPSTPRSPRSQTPASETPDSPTLPQDPATSSSNLGPDSRDHDRDPEKVRQEAWDEDSHALDYATDKEKLSDRLQGTHITDTLPAATVTPAGEQRPGVERYDTDSFEDYPDMAPKTPLGEELSASSYAEEHPAAVFKVGDRVRVLDSPTLFPAPGVGGSEASVASSVNYPKPRVGSSPAVAGTEGYSHLGTAAALGLEDTNRKARIECERAEPGPATPSSLLWPGNPAAAAGPLPPHGENEHVSASSPPHTPGGTRDAEPLAEHGSGQEEVEHGRKDDEGKDKEEKHKFGIVEKIKDALGGHKEEGKHEK